MKYLLLIFFLHVTSYADSSLVIEKDFLPFEPNTIKLMIEEGSSSVNDEVVIIQNYLKSMLYYHGKKQMKSDDFKKLIEENNLDMIIEFTSILEEDLREKSPQGKNYQDLLKQVSLYKKSLIGIKKRFVKTQAIVKVKENKEFPTRGKAEVNISNNSEAEALIAQISNSSKSKEQKQLIRDYIDKIKNIELTVKNNIRKDPRNAAAYIVENKSFSKDEQVEIDNFLLYSNLVKLHDFSQKLKDKQSTVELTHIMDKVKNAYIHGKGQIHLYMSYGQHYTPNYERLTDEKAQVVSDVEKILALLTAKKDSDFIKKYYYHPPKSRSDKLSKETFKKIEMYRDRIINMVRNSSKNLENRFINEEKDIVIYHVSLSDMGESKDPKTFLLLNKKSGKWELYLERSAEKLLPNENFEIK